VFRTSFWKELGKYLLLFGVYWLLCISFAIAKVSTCPLPPDQHSTAPHVVPPGPATPVAPPSTTCTTLTVISAVMIYAGFAFAIIWAVRIGGPRRTQLRKRLGIPGFGAGGDCCTDCPIGDNGSSSDCCLHYWCLWCALAQEMRTVMHLQALNKLPMGPPES
jgi:hypothetical protein